MNRVAFAIIITALLTGSLCLSAQDRIENVKVLNKRALQLMRTQPDSSRLLIDKAFEEAEKINYQWGKATAKNLSGRLLMLESQDIRAITEFEEALPLYEETDSVYLNNHHIIFWNIATIYYRNDVFEAASDYFQKSFEALELLIHQNQDHPKAKNREGDLLDAVYYKALSLKKLGQLNESRVLLERLWNDEFPENGLVEHRAKVLNQLGLINKDLSNFAEARYFYRQILELAEVSDLYVGRALHNTGYTWLSESEYEKAADYFKKAIAQKKRLKKSKSSQRSLFVSHLDLGEALYHQKRYREAINQWELALGLDADVSENPELFIAHNWLQQCYMLFDVEKADFHGERYRLLMADFTESKQELVQEFEGQVFRLNLEEERLKTAHEMQIISQRTQYQLVILALLLFTGLFWWWRKRIRAQRHEAYNKKMYSAATTKSQ